MRALVRRRGVARGPRRPRPEAPRGRGRRGSPPRGRRAADPSISIGTAGGRTARRERGDAPGDEASGPPRSCRPWRRSDADRAARGRRELVLVADGRAAPGAGHGAAEAAADVLAARRPAGRGRHTWQGVARSMTRCAPAARRCSGLLTPTAGAARRPAPTASGETVLRGAQECVAGVAVDGTP